MYVCGQVEELSGTSDLLKRGQPLSTSIVTVHLLPLRRGQELSLHFDLYNYSAGEREQTSQEEDAAKD